MDTNTILLRQIHESWVHDGRVGSLAFCPSPKDRNKLSVYDGDLISPEASWSHFVQKHSSAGVMGVTVAECQELGLEARPDPEPFPEHAVIDFSALVEQESKSAIKRCGKKLCQLARDRDWLFQAE